MPSHVLAAGDIPVVQIDRGGQVTYHGPGPARRLSTHRHPPRRPRRARPRDRARARRHRLLREPRHHRRVPQERAGRLCRRQEDRERRPAHPPRRQLSRPRVQREHGSRAVPAHQSLRLCRPADDAARGARIAGRQRRVGGAARSRRSCRTRWRSSAPNADRTSAPSARLHALRFPACSHSCSRMPAQERTSRVELMVIDLRPQEEKDGVGLTELERQVQQGRVSASRTSRRTRSRSKRSGPILRSRWVSPATKRRSWC